MRQQNKYQNENNIDRQKEEHYFANDSEACPEFNWATDSYSVLRDLKYLMKEFYTATFTDEGEALKLSFNNGQNFIIRVEECA